MDKQIPENEKGCNNCRWFYKKPDEEPCVYCENGGEWEEID